MGSEQMIKF